MSAQQTPGDSPFWNMATPRSKVCDGCRCVKRRTGGPFGGDMCMWPCSLLGFAPLLRRGRIVARGRWLTRRGVRP